MGLGRDRHRKPGRRISFRTPRKQILVVCEGANTEPQYFRQFATVHRNTIVSVEVTPEAGVPLSVVKKAKLRRQQGEEAAKREDDPFLIYDSIWCVFDVDEHPKIPEAIDMARANDLMVAMSNPCFELWLFLHRSEPPGMLDRHKMQKKLKDIITDYDKSVDYEDYREGYVGAVERARRLDELAESVGEPGRNPTTGVYRLTEEIAQRKSDDIVETKGKSRRARGKPKRRNA